MKKLVKRSSKGSIKFKIIVLPLIVVFLTVLGASGISAYLSRNSLLNQMREDGLTFVGQVAEQIEANSVSLETIDEMVENNIRAAGRSVISNYDNLTNELITQLAEDLQVDELNLFNDQGQIIYSNLAENVGWVAPEGHQASVFAKGTKNELMEEVRKSAVSNDYYKYGYVKNPNGGFVQVGILANTVNELSQKFSYQTLVEELTQNDDVVYAVFIDKNLKAVAHSNKDRIGVELTDEGSKTAAVDGKPYASEYFYEAGNVMVYDVLEPVTVNGEHVGAINIGLSMKKVNDTIFKTIFAISIFGLIAFAVIGVILFMMSNYIIKTLNATKEHLNLIATGDLTTEVPQKYLGLKDEFGEISNAIQKMQLSVREMISRIKQQSNLLNTNSESLVAVSEEMASSSQELASTMQQVADGATSQANDLNDIVNSLSQLTSSIENVYKELKNVMDETDNTTNKANIGKEEMDKLIKSINEIKNAFEIVAQKIGNLTNSVKEISSITEVISGISEQTNLLALNAAIEAARAGEMGRGFAVVAEEVRKLAEESKKSTDEISKLVSSINVDTDEVLKTSKDVEEFIKSQADSVENTVKSFADILTSIDNIAPLMSKTYKGMDEIVKSKDKVLERVEEVSAVTEENSAASEEVAASSEQLTASTEEIASTAQNLSAMAEELMDSVNKFKI